MKIYLDTIGCRLNQSEIESMARGFRAAGHEIVTSAEMADMAVVNTCAVTSEAAADSRGKIRQIARAGVDKIVATGCWATLLPQQALDLPNVMRVVTNERKDHLVADVLDLPEESFDLEPIVRQPLPGLHHRTRAFIKVQDGCDNHCTFCITTIARGEGRSRLVADVILDIQSALAGGTKEIVLTGVHLGSWGYDLATSASIRPTPALPGTPRHLRPGQVCTRGTPALAGGARECAPGATVGHSARRLEAGSHLHLRDLIRTVLRETDVPRLRLSSLEPWDLDADFFSLWNDKRLMPHLHLPLQSGCESTLRRMRRKTTPGSFRELVSAARAVIPDVAITTDIIAGFPGETDEEFAESLAFVREMDFAGGHVFTYSPRPGTGAAKMKGQVKPEIRKKRNHILHHALEESAKVYSQKFLGQTMSVLWESTSEMGEWGWQMEGLTENYLRVNAFASSPRWNEIDRVTIHEWDGPRIKGIISNTG